MKLSSIEDKIIALMESKDKKFVSILYDHYANSLYGIVMRIIKDEELAKDVMQESFVKVWNNYQLYDKRKSRLFTWLLQIFRNTAIDQLRKTSKANSKLTDIKKFKEEGNVQKPIDLDTLDIGDILKKIDVKYRTVIESVYIKGMTHQQACTSLGIPLGTVKSRIRLGLSSLRNFYTILILGLIFKNLI